MAKAAPAIRSRWIRISVFSSQRPEPDVSGEDFHIGSFHLDRDDAFGGTHRIVIVYGHVEDAPVDHVRECLAARDDLNLIPVVLLNDGLKFITRRRRSDEGFVRLAGMKENHLTGRRHRAAFPGEAAALPHVSPVACADIEMIALHVPLGVGSASGKSGGGRCALGCDAASAGGERLVVRRAEAGSASRSAATATGAATPEPEVRAWFLLTAAVLNAGIASAGFELEFQLQVEVGGFGAFIDDECRTGGF